MRTMLSLSLASAALMHHAQGSKSATPDWIRMTPQESGGFQYFVGRSEEGSDEKGLLEDAFQDAYSQCIRANFGFSVEMSSQAYLTEKVTRVVARNSVSSASITLTDFVRVATHFDGGDSRKRAFALYRYSLKSRNRERERFEALSRLRPRRFSFDRDPSSTATELVVSTRPEGAEVIVDGQSYGSTPLRIEGGLKPGGVFLTLKKGGYEFIEEKIEIVRGQKTMVARDLVPEPSALLVDMELDDAKILLDESSIELKRWYGNLSPSSHSLKIKSPDIEPYYERFVLQSGEERRIFPQVKYRTIVLSVNSEPSGARLRIDGVVVGSTPIRELKIPASSRRLELIQNGKPAYTEGLRLPAGGRYDLGTIDLSTGRRVRQDAAVPSQSFADTVGASEVIWDPKVYGGLAFYTRSHPYPANLISTSVGTSVELRFAQTLGLEGGIGIGGMLGDGDPIANISLIDMYVAIPVRLRLDTDATLILGPKLGMSTLSLRYGACDPLLSSFGNCANLPDFSESRAYVGFFVGFEFEITPGQSAHQWMLELQRNRAGTNLPESTSIQFTLQLKWGGRAP